ncbi:hypothetical protein L3Q82_022952 [Scortum barcoo]|uniref:Uncharacterized protein n=1 Tax=Scortum barcoo TaxID=214431 RepID=A0ACB8WYC7_9TELE|nr:hypothetical protein L3Q82_022952 [Scortum barcoo]
MSVQFSGWEVVDDGASFPGVTLGASQKPQNKGVYAMYHGTSIAAARLIIANGFKQSTGGMLGKGVYVSRDRQKAERYPLFSQIADRVVLEVRCVRVGRVKRIDKDNHPMQFTWSSHGYNTAWVPPKSGLQAVPSGLEEDCVFDPKRVTVVGIAKAPKSTIQNELQQLLSKSSTKPGGGGGGDGAANSCRSFWDSNNQPQSSVRMSVQFSGWEVVDDGASFPGVTLGASQKPQNKGVYAMYHGTSIAAARLIIANGFKQSSGGMLGKGVYVSRDIKKASHYPLRSQIADRVVLEVRVRVGRVKRIDKDNHPMQYNWSSHGYNTAWVPPKSGLQAVPSGLEEDCVFDPKRVTVVGIAKAPKSTIQNELQQLLSKSSTKPGGGGGGDGAANCCWS